MTSSALSVQSTESNLHKVGRDVRPVCTVSGGGGLRGKCKVTHLEHSRKVCVVALNGPCGPEQCPRVVRAGPGVGVGGAGEGFN
jgi:hypothetical protein